MKPGDRPIVDQVYTITEAAMSIGVSEDTLRRRIKEGKIQMLRMSPMRVGVRASEIERYLKAAEEIV